MDISERRLGKVRVGRYYSCAGRRSLFKKWKSSEKLCRPTEQHWVNSSRVFDVHSYLILCSACIRARPPWSKSYSCSNQQGDTNCRKGSCQMPFQFKKQGYSMMLCSIQCFPAFHPSTQIGADEPPFHAHFSITIIRSHAESLISRTATISSLPLLFSSAHHPFLSPSSSRLELPKR